MTRMDSVRAATGTAKDSVLHAAEVVAPYAGTAKDATVHYAHEARARLAPKVSHAAELAAEQARHQYDAHLHPRIAQARGALPPQVDAAARRTAVRCRRAARQAADYTVPRVEHAVADVRAKAEPVRGEAVARSAAALAALRGEVSMREIEKLVRRRNRRGRAGRAAKKVVLVGVVAGAAYAAWKWWDKQTNPDWLVEPPAATEVGERAPLTAVDGTGEAVLDPEVQAKQAEAEAEGKDRDEEK
ncbi:DUF5324 family protein [Streptomyces sp. URMC 123]|uniref:DUF5324 family protein n=1 Tax=Streptomyces sp. URMC 123 TaxID=3423403 RepID=UPI003F1D8136